VEKTLITAPVSFLQKHFSLQHKTAIITGGTGVLGVVMARGLARAGANVVILGRRESLAQQFASSLTDEGARAMAITADVLREEQLVTAREKINFEFGPIDILVNAAGGNMPHAVLKPDMPWADLNLDAYAKVLDLNLLGTVIPSKVFGQDMVQKKSGVIINIASVASQLPLTQVAAYSNAKAAIKNFTQWLAVEMAQKYGEGIRVNAIAPGFFLADQNRALLVNHDGSLTERGQKAINKTPFGRFGTPEELVGTLVWLCSDASKFVTGAVIPVDGGFTAYAGV
jgi:NAD(P)-dependent dehydrogenase (short-subunit alcohol dehydrogenase family)